MTSYPYEKGYVDGGLAPSFVDSHTHIDNVRFDADREAVIQAALAGGVTRMVDPGCDLSSSRSALALAKAYPGIIFAGVGVHPHDAKTYTDEVEIALREMVQEPEVVAIGEFGLDYFRMQNTPEQQAYLFRQQLSLAKELHKPIVIHCRDAHTDVQKAIAEFYPETSIHMDCPQPVGVIHCFSGVWSDAQTYLMHGFYLGIDAPVTYPSAKALQEVVNRVPLQRIVLETDSPYLPPQAFRGQRNEPAHIPIIAEAVSTLKYKSTTDIAEATTLNARRLFRIQ